jgi:secondary thiamine-phosphate synthase enzyme
VKHTVSVHQEEIQISSRARALLKVTAEVAQVVRRSGIQTGLCTVFIQHTSASLVIQENADPAVTRDLERWISDLAPETRNWEHDDEGPDDMPAHAKCAITNSSLTIPVGSGQLTLGTWQGIYLWEHRSVTHQRRLVIHIAGE